MDGRILNISREEISEIIAMNGSKNFLNMHNKAEDPPSIDEADAPSIDGQSEFRRRVLHQNRKRKPRWEMRNEYGVISIVQHLQQSRDLQSYEDDIWLSFQAARWNLLPIRQQYKLVNHMHGWDEERHSYDSGITSSRHKSIKIDRHSHSTIDWFPHPNIDRRSTCIIRR